jgi:GTP pyrophosphokinase
MESIESKYKKLHETLKAYCSKEQLDNVQRAFDFAREAHEGQKRKTGEDYIYHPVAAAQILAGMQVDHKIIMATILHDVDEDTDKTIDEIKDAFGEDVASMVEGVTKLGTVKYRGIERYLENLRKMFLAFANDMRVIVIKFADRYHNLQTLYALPRNKQERIANEVLEIYAPIATRLGMFEMKGMLEAEAFKYVNPKEYNWVSGIFEREFKSNQLPLEHTIIFIEDILKKNNIEWVSIKGRTKQLYSLYKKLLTYDRSIDRVHDFTAIRVIVKTIPECYQVLGVIHNSLTPLKGRFKDYIAQPKPNGYQSLHTTVFSPDEAARRFEIQIRTEDMDREAEYGIAAHWFYKENGSSKKPRHYEWIDQITQWKQEFTENQAFLEDLKLDVFQDRIFVFTPKGDVIELPEESTPIDFAYHVHTELGNQCIGAIVNNSIVQLDAQLKSGDVIEILRDKNRKHPNPDWQKWVRTSMAKDKIKSALKKKRQSILGKLMKNNE